MYEECGSVVSKITLALQEGWDFKVQVGGESGWTGIIIILKQVFVLTCENPQGIWNASVNTKIQGMQTIMGREHFINYASSPFSIEGNSSECWSQDLATIPALLQGQGPWSREMKKQIPASPPLCSFFSYEVSVINLKIFLRSLYFPPTQAWIPGFQWGCRIVWAPFASSSTCNQPT